MRPASCTPATHLQTCTVLSFLFALFYIILGHAYMKLEAVRVQGAAPKCPDCACAFLTRALPVLGSLA